MSSDLSTLVPHTPYYPALLDSARQFFKYNDEALSASLYGSTPQTMCCNLILQGTQETNRLANKVFIRTMELRYVAVQNTSVAGSDQALRHVLFIDRQPNGNSVTAANLFAQTGGLQIVSPYNFDFLDRFEIIDDWYDNVALSSNAVVHGQRFYDINLESSYSGSGMSITSLATNALWYWVFGQNSTSSGNNISVYSRIYFDDV